jgi:hypothetical protein
MINLGAVAEGWSFHLSQEAVMNINSVKKRKCWVFIFLGKYTQFFAIIRDCCG